MENELWSLDLDSLKKMYAKESKKLADALLEGSDWDGLNEQRLLVTRLSIIIERKSSGVVDNPAENAISTHN
jgi:hypothetical protein